jgi:hypothetical protein
MRLNDGNHSMACSLIPRHALQEQGVELKPWQLRDLRRTARTLMSRAGISTEIAERALGHVMTLVRGTYDRPDYLAEKRDAFEQLATLVERIVNPPRRRPTWWHSVARHEDAGRAGKHELANMPPARVVADRGLLTSILLVYEGALSGIGGLAGEPSHTNNAWRR